MPITALVVQVPEAEAVVGQLRLRFDPTASLGVPAHVTVLVPFVDADEIGEQALERLKSLFSGLAPFPYRFGTVGRFPDATYLAPEDPTPFIALTRKVVEAFPGYPPYGGAFADIVPHLTVAQGARPGLDVAHEELNAWARGGKSLHGQCKEVLLLQQESKGWRVRHTFRLANGDA